MRKAGDPEIDAVRRAVLADPTSPDTVRARAVVLYSWMRLAQRMGHDVSAVSAAHHTLRRVDREGINADAAAAVDRAFAAMEKSWATPRLEAVTMSAGGAPVSAEGDWPGFHGDAAQAGVAASAGRGAGVGELAWSAALGLGWYARPVVSGGRVYATSPGMRTQLRCFSADDGRAVWDGCLAEDAALGVDLHPYGWPCAASSPIVRRSDVVVREMGSGGPGGVAKHAVRYGRDDGACLGKADVGHVDYRQGYPLLVGDETRLVGVSGATAIGERPPRLAPPEWVERFEATGEQRVWRAYVGPTFAEPMLLDGAVITANQRGQVWCLGDQDPAGSEDEGPYEPRKGSRTRWVVSLGAAVTQRPACFETPGGEPVVVVSDRAGRVHALRVTDGAVVWASERLAVEPRAFVPYSCPVRLGDTLVFGSAASELVGLSLDDGAVRWRVETDDWVRARPWATADGGLIAATLSGTVTRWDVAYGAPVQRWSLRVGEGFGVYADLAGDEGSVYLNDAGLRLYAVDVCDGRVRWRQTLLKSVTDGSGRVYDADTLGGGGFHQSSPTIAAGRVLVGSANRSVTGFDLGSGRRRWRFEASAAVSGAPLLHAGRVYFGQQGGDRTFYCVDAATGAPVWTQTLGWVWSSAQAVGDLIVVPGVDGHVSGLDAATGAVRWRVRTGGACHPPAAIDTARGVAVIGSWDGMYYLIDTASGAVRHAVPTEGVPDSGAAAVHGGRAWLSMMSERMIAVDLRDGTVADEFRVPAHQSTINVTAAIDAERLIVSSGETPTTTAVSCTIFCLDPRSGAVRWSYPGGGLNSAAVWGDVVVFASSTDPFITAVRDRGDHAELLWRYDTGAFTEEASPAVGGGRVAHLSADGVLRVLR